MNTIAELYAGLPEETDPSITIRLRNIVIDFNLEDIDHSLLPCLEDESIDELTRFYIYYSISIFFRRYEHHSRFFELVNKWSKHFSSHPLNYVILSLYHKYWAIDYNKTDSLRYAIKNAERAVALMPDNSAVINNYAELIAIAIDEKYPVEHEKVMTAIDLLDKIISSNDAYAKWHYTKGKLLFSIKEYHEAKECVRIAIDLEPADNKDSLLRIAQYNNTLLDFRTTETIEKIENNLQEAKKEIIQMNAEQDNRSKNFFVELDTVKSKYLEFLAFFASIVAFITASINIVTTYGDAVTAGGLIVILSGALSEAFCIFRLLISYNKKRSNGLEIVSMILSFLLMAVGFAICFWWRKG